jgi:hypothetical protein
MRTAINEVISWPSRIVCLLVVFILLCLPRSASSEDLSEPPFAPVWQLLNKEQKQQFIAGYLLGMKDAATMTGVLRDFVQSNPTSAQESLERLRGIYDDLSQGKPDTVSDAIDRFFKDPANKEAPLSRAITAARSGV